MSHGFDSISKVIIPSISQMIPQENFAFKLEVFNEGIFLEVLIVFQKDVMLYLHFYFL